MAKELPYFKFYPGEWLTGDITLLDESAQGAFILLCCHYWLKKGEVTLANAKQRLSGCLAQLERMLGEGIIKQN
jgi:hypothetical protein